MSYEYCNNNLQEPKRYSYCEFKGLPFMWEYFANRLLVLQNATKSTPKPKESLEIPSKNGYKTLQNLLNDAKNDEKILDLLIKTFEVNKRLYQLYDFGKNKTNQTILRPDKSTDFNNLSQYETFANLLAKAHQKARNPYFLNTLLKVNDILCDCYLNSRGGGAI